MKILLRFTLCQLLFISAAYAHICENETLVETVLKQVQMKPAADALVDCKADPENASQMIMAYADWQPAHADEGIGRYQLKILKFAKDSLKVNFVFADQDRPYSDAVALASIQLDTANYKITPDTRALGVRLAYAGQSRANPWSFSVLNLYNLKNKRKVLDRLIVDQFQAETDTRCNAEAEARKSTLVMQRTQSNQAFNILVRSRIERYQSRGTIDHCVDSKRKFSEQSLILKFDGAQYQIPKAYRSEYQY